MASDAWRSDAWWWAGILPVNPPKKPALSVMEMRDMFAEACQRAGQMTKVSHIVGVVNSMRPGMHLEKMTEER